MKRSDDTLRLSGHQHHLEVADIGVGGPGFQQTPDSLIKPVRIIVSEILPDTQSLAPGGR